MTNFDGTVFGSDWELYCAAEIDPNLFDGNSMKRKIRKEGESVLSLSGFEVVKGVVVTSLDILDNIGGLVPLPYFQTAVSFAKKIIEIVEVSGPPLQP